VTVTQSRASALQTARAGCSITNCHPAVAGIGGINVLLGYSIMLESWDLENEPATAGYVGDPSDPKSDQLLTALADGNGAAPRSPTRHALVRPSITCRPPESCCLVTQVDVHAESVVPRQGVPARLHPASAMLR
jgi:hypothetical protein